MTFDCKTDAGHASCLNRETDGVSQPAIFGTDNGTDGPGGQKITLHVENTLGDVEVRRA